MLKINPAPTFEFDAQLTVPGAEALATVRFTARYKSRDEINAWLASAKAAGTDQAFMGPVFVSWSGIGDEQGQAVPYSPAKLGELFNAYPAAAKELLDQYLEQMLDSRRKN